MSEIEVKFKFDADAWSELEAFAKERRLNTSELLTDAIKEYLQRNRVRPEVLTLLEQSMKRNEKLGRLLAK